MDTFDAARARMADQINAQELPLEQLRQQHGEVWSTQDLTTEFDVLSFAAPFVVVQRKSDGQHGTLTFQHRPRFYFGFQPGK